MARRRTRLSSSTLSSSDVIECPPNLYPDLLEANKEKDKENGWGLTTMSSNSNNTTPTTKAPVAGDYLYDYNSDGYKYYEETPVKKSLKGFGVSGAGAGGVHRKNRLKCSLLVTLDREDHETLTTSYDFETANVDTLLTVAEGVEELKTIELKDVSFRMKLCPKKDCESAKLSSSLLGTSQILKSDSPQHFEYHWSRMSITPESKKRKSSPSSSPLLAATSTYVTETLGKCCNNILPELNMNLANLDDNVWRGITFVFVLFAIFILLFLGVPYFIE